MYKRRQAEGPGQGRSARRTSSDSDAVSVSEASPALLPARSPIIPILSRRPAGTSCTSTHQHTARPKVPRPDRRPHPASGPPHRCV
ncbi:hypothetical protein C2E23DRAFT_838377 [Lenzites betulinus]|nr:hypothetical protein C2E23DRAFT_838377 [Lenzites betulinus]